MSKLSIGSRIVMPEPQANDNWRYGGFMGRVVDFIESKNLAIIEDQDSDMFSLEIDRAEKAMVDENDL